MDGVVDGEGVGCCSGSSGDGDACVNSSSSGPSVTMMELLRLLCDRLTLSSRSLSSTTSGRSKSASNWARRCNSSSEGGSGDAITADGGSARLFCAEGAAGSNSSSGEDERCETEGEGVPPATSSDHRTRRW